MRFGGWRLARLAMRTGFVVQRGPAGREAVGRQHADRETAGRQHADRETVGRQHALARAWEVMRFGGWRLARLLATVRTHFAVQWGPAGRETVGRQPALARA